MNEFNFSEMDFKELQRQLFDGYAVGDIVYVPEYKIVSRELCPKCGGLGRYWGNLMGKDRVFDCHCYSRHIVQKEWTPNEDVIVFLSIGQFEDGEILKEVMLKQTGSYFDEHLFTNSQDLFKTKEDCQLSCDRRNQKNSAGVMINE